MSSKDAAKRPKPKQGTGERQPRGTANARKTAVITGVTGQDGSYLAELLLEKGYEAIGVVRRPSHDSSQRTGHLLDRRQIVDAVLSTLALRRRESLRTLDHGELPRVVRHVRGQRHSVQPRVAAPRPRVRHAQSE